ncbi:fungal-specific transcription factor domain-containing protein [Armillaria nabsnona]|nr:fungal-specific transcription factor domain-containing protein [Armillaria nabsnona]
MSSDESVTEKPPQKGWKKRRLQGACDACRRKKIKCDSRNMPGNQCSNCRAFNSPCTHDEPAKKRGPKSNYVTRLEKRVLKLEEILKQFQPDVTIPDFDEPASSAGTSNNLDNSNKSSPLSDGLDAGAATDESDTDPDMEYIEVMGHLKKLSLHMMDNRYFGPSSNLAFMRKAFSMKSEQTGQEVNVKKDHWKNWQTHPWEQATVEMSRNTFYFPPPDLLADLVELYFTHFHPYMPILHEPNFRHSVVSGQHHVDHRFGAVLLLVCAVASRASNDPRVFLEGMSEHSSGWRWFVQTREMPRALFDMPSLHDLQFCSLSAEFLLATSSPQSAWTMIGLGIRYGVEMGLHRQRPERPTYETELSKRAFWGLYVLDRHLCLYHGRPPAIRDEDFDLDFPIICDDEYWAINEGGCEFTQPPGVHSRMDYFIMHLRLCQIMSFAVRTLYSIRKAKQAEGLVGASWPQNIVSQLDSMLNGWIIQMPAHLKWGQHRENRTFSFQAALLYATYYHVQIQIHRPFIHKSSPLTFPSLAICTNAARSCSRVLEVQREDSPPLQLFGFSMAAFSSAIILAMNMWSTSKPGSPTSSSSMKEMEDIDRCLSILELSAKRWNISGRLVDILRVIVGDAPPSTETQLKGRNAISDFSLGGPHSYMASDSNTNSFFVNAAWPPQPRATATQSPMSVYSNVLNQAPGVSSSSIAEPTAAAFTRQEQAAHVFCVKDPSTGMQESITLTDGATLKPDAINMWSNVPMGFSWNDWGAYISSMGT